MAELLDDREYSDYLDEVYAESESDNVNRFPKPKPKEKPKQKKKKNESKGKKTSPVTSGSVFASGLKIPSYEEYEAENGELDEEDFKQMLEEAGQYMSDDDDDLGAAEDSIGGFHEVSDDERHTDGL